LLVACVVGLVACAPGPVVERRVVTGGAGARFTVTLPDAQSVTVAGSFNRWSVTAHQMVRSGSDGTWTVAIPLPPGEYLFIYVVDGKRWVTPPNADDYVDDGFGQKNGVVVVR
jgi:1,4-alpha-glucan branching enzyme